MQTISRRTARRIALAAQGFADPAPAARVDVRHLRRAYERMSVLQIDSVNVLTRAHYLPVFARLGGYDRGALDAMERPRRLVFEYWAHMASYSAVEHHRLLRWRMDAFRERTWSFVDSVVRRDPDLVDRMRELVRDRGPITASQADPQRIGKVRGEMWSWHDAKAALEYLFRVGEIASAGRNSQFEKVFDLPKRVLPAEVLAAPTPSREDAQRELLAVAARSHGIATAGHLRDYFRIRGRHTDALIAELVEDRVLEVVHVEGDRRRWYLHTAARRPRRVDRAALLSPFDPVIWERDRTATLWDCHYRIGIYTPAHKRVDGYYVLPFLLDEQIAGRVDLKADRKAGALLVQAAYAEPSTTLASGYIADRLAIQLRSMATWLGLDDVVVRDRGDLAATLRTASLA